jgi:hypothetical protein
MISVIIRDYTHAMAAATWCIDNLDRDSWRIELVDFAMSAAQYCFSFSQGDAATCFALKFYEI